MPGRLSQLSHRDVAKISLKLVAFPQLSLPEHPGTTENTHPFRAHYLADQVSQFGRTRPVS
jgi:hypothetical protein